MASQDVPSENIEWRVREEFRVLGKQPREWEAEKS